MSQNGCNGEAKEFTEITIPVPWGHISGKWWGSRNVQPILAIHGWQDNAGTFDNLAPILKDRGLSILCIDLPGHGFSSHLPQGQSYHLWWDGVLFLRRIVKFYNWKEIIILGHSLGGGIGFLYSAIYPEEVKKYISIDIASPSVHNIKKMIALAGPSIDKFLDYEKLTIDKMPCYDYNEMLDLIEKAYGGSVSRESCKIMLRRGMKEAKHKEGYLFTRDPRLKVSTVGFFSLDQVLELATHITCEVLNIRGNPGMKFDHPENYNKVLDVIEKQAKKMERHIVAGTHHLHLNDANSIADIIYNFIVA